MISNLLSGFNLNSSLISEKNCKRIYHNVGERNIVLRIDDIQAFYNQDIEIKMLKELEKREFTAVLG